MIHKDTFNLLKSNRTQGFNICSVDGLAGLLTEPLSLLTGCLQFSLLHQQFSVLVHQNPYIVLQFTAFSQEMEVPDAESKQIMVNPRQFLFACHSCKYNHPFKGPIPRHLQTRATVYMLAPTRGRSNPESAFHGKQSTSETPATKRVYVHKRRGNGAYGCAYVHGILKPLAGRGPIPSEG